MENLLPRYYTSKIWMMGINATLGSFIFGYNIGVMTNLKKVLSAYLDWGSNEDLFFFLFLPAMQLGAMFGALFAGSISDKLGRRRALIIHDLIIIAGSVIVALPVTPFFVIGRTICGYGAGGFASIVPNYLREISPDPLYGRIGSLVQFQVALGIVVSFAIALGLPTGDYENSSLNYFWIFLYAFQGLLAAIQMLIFLFIFKNETPSWLRSMNMKEKALAAFEEIYNQEEANALFEKLETEELKECTPDSDKSYAQLMCCRQGTSKMMRMGILINVFQQTVGINAILGYLTEIFSKINNDVEISRVFTLLGGFVNMVATILVFPLVGKYGRKTLMIFGNVGIVVCMIGTAIFSGPADSVGTAPSIIFILIFFVFFEVGIGPICWVFCGDILTSKAISICTTVNWVANFITVLAYPFIEGGLGFSWTVGIYGVIALISVFYIHFDLIETRGLSPKEIDVLMNGRPAKEISP